MSEKSNANNGGEYPLDRVLRDCVVDRLNDFDRRTVVNPNLTQSAVAFTILDGLAGNDACFLLTRRPTHMKRHGGQYALPGGRLEKNETPVAASLRELNEEIGIEVSENDVLGLLDDYETRSGFNITPVVVWAGTRTQLNPDPNEVAKVFRVPLAELASPKIPYLEDSAGGETQVLSAPLKTLKHRVFAPTAAVLYQFREVALFGRDTRVAHFDQPKFAWK